MRFTSALRCAVLIGGVLGAALCLCAQPPKLPVEAVGIPPRASPSDYQFHATAGKLTLAAEFTGHFVATPEGTLTTDDFVVIEAGIYGPAGTRLALSPGNFALRINDKKPLTGQPYGLVVRTLKDPSMQPPASENKSKSSFGTGAQADTSSTPPPVHVPEKMRFEWDQRLQKASMPEGNRALPKAGLLYFAYHGKTDKIDSLELTYTGPAGTVKLDLQP